MTKKKGGAKGAVGASGAGDSAAAPASTSAASGEPEPTLRGRGGFKQQELNTIPQGMTVVSTGAQVPGQATVEILANFISIKPMKQSKPIYSYRVDFEPSLESSKLKTKLFYRATREVLSKDAIFDDGFEARSSIKTREPITHLKVSTREQPDVVYTVILKLVGNVSPGTAESLRVYNTHLAEFFKILDFRRLGSKGGYLDPTMSFKIPDSGLEMMQGFKTSVNWHERGQILMNLEPNHKLIQTVSVNELIIAIARAGGNWKSNVTSDLEGKLVITTYDSRVYRIESVNYQMNPKCKFIHRALGKEITYLDYFKSKNCVIKDPNQPLLLAVPNNKRREQEATEKGEDIYMIPELCILTGLTTSQRNDFRLRGPMIKASQIEPSVRVKNINDFLKKLQDNKNIQAKLAAWGYSYDTQPTKIKARVMPMEKVGDGKIWLEAERETGSFERILMQRPLGKIPIIQSLVILVPRNITRDRGPGSGEDVKNDILKVLSGGFTKVGLKLATNKPIIKDLPNDRPDTFLREIRQVPPGTTATIVVMNRQQKSTYDAIKKEASVERALITQVVTAKLLTDPKKASGAAVKIAIQIAAKIGGEPWLLNMPTKGDMICGYDTYHDTANSGRSYGAFLASMNDSQSRWFSRADQHDKKCEISPHMPTNVSDAMKKYQNTTGAFPKRVIIYRDGVGDGQLEEVFRTEVQQVLKSIKKVNSTTLLTFITVNKRIGARFYQIKGNSYVNPSPGSVIDTVVTRSSRFDFFLISQHTRSGSVTPTYYNVIFDQSKTSPVDHQALAYKLCFLYYNWAGTVRVPAPCQYAHKLALLCGEHLHRVPNDNLCDRLHFL